MLEIITDILYTKVNGYFDRLIPLAEKVHSGDKSMPKEYIGNGNYRPINPDNFAGLGYFRQTEPVTISDVESRGNPMNDLKKYDYEIRLVGAVKKGITGEDNSFSSDSLGILISKNLQETNGQIRSLLGARNVTIAAKKINTDPKEVFSEEYSGSETDKGAPLTYSLIAIDITVSIDIEPTCINTICSSYCSSGMGRVVVVNAGGNLSAAVLTIIPNVYVYTVPELYGAEVVSFLVQNFTGANNDCTLSGTTFTITNTQCDVSESYPLIIYYRK